MLKKSAKTIHYNAAYMLVISIGMALVVMFGRTFVGITMAILVEIVAVCFLNYKRLFVAKINNLNPKRAYVIETICSTCAIIWFLFSSEGSILNFKGESTGETLMELNLLFLLIGGLLFTLPMCFSWKKMMKDPNIKIAMKKLRNKERIDDDEIDEEKTEQGK